MVDIVVVEDDVALSRIVTQSLVDHGYNVHAASSGQAALARFAQGHVDMVISDIMMPGMDGFALAELIRGLDAQIPILFMTARDDFAAKKRGFKLGIDDYMVKPIDLDELVLRVGALLRRAKIAVDKRVQVGNLILDADAVMVTMDGQEVPVTVREFNILFKLLSNPNRAYTRAQLLDEFWDPDASTGLRAVDVYVTKLREKFAASQDFSIVTVHGLGYKAVLT
ncbi:MAG: response regulator transcription factor [Propionibacteriaceae bacterium]|jgi:DNA-binding response OmpR family regulator|nr:response regulator transcription factor [Propionibacteriaceae bacterium]